MTGISEEKIVLSNVIMPLISKLLYTRNKNKNIVEATMKK